MFFSSETGLGMREIVIDFRIWAQVEVSGDGVEPCWEWVDLGVHCVVEAGLKTCDWEVVTSKPAPLIVSVKRM